MMFKIPFILCSNMIFLYFKNSKVKWREYNCWLKVKPVGPRSNDTCICLLELPEQNTVDWVVSTTDIYFSHFWRRSEVHYPLVSKIVFS